MGEVVDDRLKVKGVEGLRVVDASVFPGHVSGNIMATTQLRRKERISSKKTTGGILQKLILDGLEIEHICMGVERC